jgi:HYR domain-containing protein/proprotein convertase P-domain-containing protein
MRKITLLLLMLIAFTGFSQQAQLGENGVEPNSQELGNRIATGGNTFRGPCMFVQPTAGVPNGLNVAAGTGFAAADDVDVPAGNFTPDSYVASVLITVGATFTTVDFIVYDDAGGLPGIQVGSALGLVPVSQAIIGSAFGRDIREVTLDLSGSGIVLPGSQKYWVRIITSNTLANGDNFIEATATITGLESSFSLDNGATWMTTTAVFGSAFDWVINLSALCGSVPIAECGNAPELIPAGAALPTPSSGPMDPSIATVPDSGLIGTAWTLDDITLNIEHTWASDLLIVLTSPGGTPITLSDSNGGSTGLDIAADLVFTDGSGNVITGWGGGAPAPDYRPEGGLFNTVFAGEDVNGPWTIDILDQVGGDIGVLNSYCINFSPILGSPPVIACPADIIVDTDAGACGAVVNYVAVAIDPDGDLDTVVQTIPDPNVLGSGDEFPVGTTAVTFRATDLAGNFAECTFNVTVNDNEDPVVVCNDLTVELDAAGNVTVDVNDVATVTDNCPGSTILFGGLAPGALTTSFVSNNGSAGNMFDVMPLNDITVNSFDVNNTSGGTVDYEIYFKTGTYVGSETTAGDWTLVGSALGVAGAGQDNSTPLGLAMGVNLTAGNIYAFYVADIGPGTHRYINGGTAGDLWASDANLEIYLQS